MANENEQKKVGVAKLIDDMETLWAKMEREGLDDTATSIAAENLRKNLDYLESLPNDEDRIIFINSKGNGFKEWMFDTPSPTAGILEVQKQLEDLGPAKKITRDERGHKTATREQVFKQMDETATMEELTDPSDERSWYNRPTEELKANAKALGLDFGDYMNLLQTESAKYGREKIVNEPGAQEELTRMMFPRVTKRLTETGDYKLTDMTGDLAENAAQTLPVGKVMAGATRLLPRIVPKIWKLKKVRGAADGAMREVRSKVRMVPKIERDFANSAVVPGMMELHDASAENRDVDLDKVKIGTEVNFATPKQLQFGLRTVGRYVNNKKLIDKARRYLASDFPLMNFVVNKAGKTQYGTGFDNIVTSVVPLAADFTETQKKKKADAEAEKKRKEQKRRQKIREDEMNEQYRNIMLAK